MQTIVRDLIGELHQARRVVGQFAPVTIDGQEECRVVVICGRVKIECTDDRIAALEAELEEKEKELVEAQEELEAAERVLDPLKEAAEALVDAINSDDFDGIDRHKAEIGELLRE